jgi:exopolyphosphatase/guanosine-5'-triphosphate,3'-diphosphate pyrophosphatase
VTHYPLPVVHSYHLSGDALERFLQPRKLLFQKEESQKSLGLSKKQAEVITFASLALDGVLRHGRPAHVIFSTSGLREGCLFDLLPPSETAADPLLRACEQFARRISCLPPNTDELEEWVLRLFPDADEPFRRLCKAACLLCDISLYESRDFRSRNAFERIINLPLLGIDHAGRVFLALVLHARYAGNLEGAHLLPFLDFLHPDDVERALDLGLTLRLAQTLCGRTQGILMHTQLQVDGDELVLLAPTDMPFVIGDAVQKHLKALANALALNPSIQECESPAQPVF